MPSPTPRAPRPARPALRRTGAALAALALLVPGALHAQRHTLGGSSIAIYNVAGRVRLVAGAGSEVAVDVSRQGRDASRLRIEQGEVRGRETLRVIYPDDRVIYPEIGRWSRTRSRIRDDGTFGDSGGGGSFGGSREIEVRSDGDGLEAWADLTVSVPAGQRLAIHLMAGEATVTNVDGDITVDVHSAAVATDRTRGRLLVDAGSGRVRVTGAEGEVALDLGSGDAEVRGMRGSRLSVDAGSGGFTGENIEAPTVDLDLGSGRTRLSGVRARDLRIDSGSGSVDVALLDDVDDVRIDSGSGSVTLRVPANLGAELDVDTGSGGIETEIPITVTRRARDRLVGTIGDGRGRIVIDSGSGAVRLVRG